MKFVIGPLAGGEGFQWRLLDEEGALLARSPNPFSSLEEAEKEVINLQRGASTALMKLDDGLLTRIPIKN
ncbi:hypothetical protein [Variovorax sp. UMC13]|uniref:hypothetical protein n=1 Tax=Variovorax sp. UMC13 TaxID=1862326 RepID=UPI0016040223|nr:hypothetical protein [Variovorax sp. UMC13]